MSRAFTVALIGAGPRAAVIADAVRGAGGVVTGVWDRTPERATALATVTAARPFDDIETLVTSTAPDLAAVITHPAARSSLVSAAVDGGARRLLLEKPIALDRAELARVRLAAGSVGVAVNTQYRWMPHWQTLLARIQHGEIGDVQHIRASCAAPLLEQGPHLVSLIDAIREAADLPDPTRIQASGDADIGDVGTEWAAGQARISIAAGAHAPTVTGEDVIWFQQQIEILGALGRMRVTLNRGWWCWTGDGGTSGSTAWPRDDGPAQVALIRALVDATEQEVATSFPTRLAAAERQARWLFDVLDCARTGHAVVP